MQTPKQTILVDQLAAWIVKEIRAGRLTVGEHLTAQGLADRHGVSRSPIARALEGLASAGILRHEPRRGYFVTTQPSAPAPLPPFRDDPVQTAYVALAEDRLEGRIPQVVSLAFLQDRYRLTPAQSQALTTRVLREGWLERRPGYGFRFTEILTSADALLQTYRVRMALEPAALLEPGYRLEAQGARACRQIEEHLLDGGVESVPREDLYDRGVRFHELIVAGSGNPFFLDALRRINGVRRLLAYRAAGPRERYYDQARDHLAILDLLEAGRNGDAADRLRVHLEAVVRGLEAIRPVLENRKSR